MTDYWSRPYPSRYRETKPAEALAPAAPAVPTPQPAPRVAPKLAVPRTYVVQQWDTGTKIAKLLTGDPNRWRELLTTNPEKGHEALGLKLSVGDVIRLPDAWIPDEVKSAPVQAPFMDSWPAAPPGMYYVPLGGDMHGAVPLPPGECYGRVQIAPDRLFKPMFLWCRPMRGVFLTEYKIGSRSCINSWREIATSVFRRFAPFETDTAQIGNIISLGFANRHPTRSYTPEVVILGLVGKNS